MHISLSLSNSSKTIFDEFKKFNLVQCISSEYYKHKEFEMYNNILIFNFVVWKFCGEAQFPHSFGRQDWKIVAYQGIINISFTENFAYILNE